MSAPVTSDELFAAYEASTFPRSLSFEQACELPWSRVALELGALLLRRADPAHVEIAHRRPQPPLQRRLPL